MTFKKKRGAGLTTSADVTVATVYLGAKYARFYGFRARNWASSAKASAGVDTLQRVRLTDANSDIFYLDAADRDYATAELTMYVGRDDTATGLNTTAVDATGAAITAGGGLPLVIESPVTVGIVNGGTTTDYFEIDLMVEV